VDRYVHMMTMVVMAVCRVAEIDTWFSNKFAKWVIFRPWVLHRDTSRVSLGLIYYWHSFGLFWMISE